MWCDTSELSFDALFLLSGSGRHWCLSLSMVLKDEGMIESWCCNNLPHASLSLSLSSSLVSLILSLPHPLSPSSSLSSSPLSLPHFSVYWMLYESFKDDRKARVLLYISTRLLRHIYKIGYRNGLALRGNLVQGVQSQTIFASYMTIRWWICKGFRW